MSQAPKHPHTTKQAEENQASLAKCACGETVTSDDPYFATPCGSFCPACMEEHATECDGCAKQFDLFQHPEEETLV